MSHMGEFMAQSTLTTRHVSDKASRPTVSGKRADIQGLRALAVVAVVLDHFLHWPSGGFVGVDVFFVISGFLITGLLLREYDRTGTVSFMGFYKRRIRRIMPAAVVVLAASSAAAYLFLNTARAGETLTDSIWALFFSANWHFASVGTDYFQAGGPVSPVQHFWSLAVEEQFYLVWPWLMLAIFWVGGRTKTGLAQTRAHTAIAVASVAIVALSFAWSTHESAISPTVAYFSTTSRAWELGVGALLAVLGPLFLRIPSVARPLLAWAGIAGIVWSAFTISPSMLFPAPWAAAPVLATALVVMAGTGGEQRFLWPLTNRVSGYVGDISYSLYLWHFPVVILAQALLPQDSLLFYSAAAVCMVALSSASFHLVEEPVRRSEWLLPKTRHAMGLDPTRLKYVFLALLAVATTVVCAAAVLQTTPKQPSAGSVVATSGAGAETAAPVDKTPQGILSSQISAALDLQTFPKLNPSIDSLGIEKWSKRPEVACMNVSADNVDACLTGPEGATKTVAVLGDSVAVAWLPGIRAALEPLGYRVQALTMGQCPAAAVAVKKAGGELFPECDTHLEWAVERVRFMRPDLTILATAQESTFSRLASGKKGPDAATEVAQGLASTVDEISASTKRIAILSSPPSGKDLRECMTNIGKPSDCVSALSDDWVLMKDAEAKVAVGPQMTHVNTSPWMCDGRYCPAFVGSTPVRVDTGHLTVEYSKRLAPLIAASLK